MQDGTNKTTKGTPDSFVVEDDGKYILIMYGALGKDSVRNIYETSCGTILEGKEKNIYRTTELWEFMESVKD